MQATPREGRRSCRWCAQAATSLQPCPLRDVAVCVAERPTSRRDRHGHCVVPGQFAGRGGGLSPQGQGRHQVQRKVQGDRHACCVDRTGRAAQYACRPPASQRTRPRRRAACPRAPARCTHAARAPACGEQAPSAAEAPSASSAPSTQQFEAMASGDLYNFPMDAPTAILPVSSANEEPEQLQGYWPHGEWPYGRRRESAHYR